MGYFDSKGQWHKSFSMLTAVRKLRKGLVIKANHHVLQTRFKTRRDNTEVWQHHPGVGWTKYGSLKDFRIGERDKRFIVCE